jgi:two-component system, sensor histidine kinase and response regulator
MPTSDGAGRPLYWQGVARDITDGKRVALALADSERRFRAAFAHAPVGMALVAPDGRWLDVNPALCAMLGSDAVDLLGTTFTAQTYPDDREISLATLKAIVNGEHDVATFEKRYVGRDGRVVWALLSAALVRDADGAPRYFVSQIQDITEHKALATERSTTHQRTREVLERISDGFYALDQDWRFTYVNEAAERLLGVTRAALLGQRLWTAFPEIDETPLAVAYRQALTEGRTIGLDFDSPVAGGWLEVRVYPSPDGLSVFFRDISDRKATEAALRAAKEEAEAASRLKSLLLSTAAHELRTPLTAIRGYADLLAAGPIDALTAEQRTDLALLAKAAKRLSDLVETLLDLSRIEAGTLEVRREPVDLATLLHEAVADLRSTATAKGLRVVVDLPNDLPPVLADPIRLRQVLVNLLDNAVKFTEHGVITIAGQVDVARVTVRIRDTGIGIAPAALPHLFEPFWQADGSWTRRSGGIGLGLAIAQRLAVLQGGTLVVESAPGVGSVFTLTLTPHGITTA